MPNLYTINGLAEETGIDRRTIKSRLRDVPPTGKKGRYDAWLLSDVLPILFPARPRFTDSSQPPPPPPGCSALAKVEDPMAALSAMPMMLMTYRVPALAAIYAVEAGSSCRAAYGLYAAMQLAMTMQCQSIGKLMKIEPWVSSPDPDIWEMDEFNEVNWPVLVAKTDETVDLDEWRNYVREQFQQTFEK